MWQAFKINRQINIIEMFSLFEFDYKYKYDFPGEVHNFWECVYVIDGEICVSGDERVYNLTKGEIIFHKPMELHKFHVDTENGAKLFIFSFNAEGNLTEFMQNKVFKLSLSQKEIVDNLLKYLRKNSVPGSYSIKELQYLQQFPKSQLYSHTVITYITQLFLSLASNSLITETSSAPDAIVFNNAVNYMNTHISDSISVDNIAAHCNISVAGIKRIFCKYGGMGVHKYFLKLKVKAANEMLENGMSITSVASALGFSSQAYFSKVFKRETGIYASSMK